MEYQCPEIYSEEAGDPDNGISPGTKLEDLPASWVCPICGADKAGFENQLQLKPEYSGKEHYQLFTLGYRTGVGHFQFWVLKNSKKINIK